MTWNTLADFNKCFKMIEHENFIYSKSFYYFVRICRGNARKNLSLTAECNKKNCHLSIFPNLTIVLFQKFRISLPEILNSSFSFI